MSLSNGKEAVWKKFLAMAVILVFTAGSALAQVPLNLHGRWAEGPNGAVDAAVAVVVPGDVKGILYALDKSMASASAGDPSTYESGSTTHYSVMDKAGNMVAVTTTINYLFGSGVVVPGTVCVGPLSKALSKSLSRSLWARNIPEETRPDNV